jgi:hypothetical protein
MKFIDLIIVAMLMMASFTAAAASKNLEFCAGVQACADQEADCQLTCYARVGKSESETTDARQRQCRQSCRAEYRYCFDEQLEDCR